MKTPFILVAIALGLAVLTGGYPPGSPTELASGIGALVGALWLGDAAPALSHAIPGVLACVALGIVLWRRQVVQTPSLRVWMALAAFLGIVGVSVVLSNFRMVSMQAWLEWATYVVGFCAVIATAGRDRGPIALLWTLTGATAFVAIRGLLEYAGQNDPTWRIFSGWVNPNALAGMLLLGFFPALGLVLAGGHRLERFGAGALAVVIGLALALTQSKGGYLAMAVGALALLFFATFWGGWRRALPAIVPLLCVGVLVLGLSLRQPPESGAGALARVAQVGATSEQSAGFRILLWKSALALAQKYPAGVGIGTFRFESSRPGLVPQTAYAHQSFMQVAAEAGALGLFLLVAALSLWLAEVLRGARALPQRRNLLRAAVLGAVTAGVAHSFIDSDLYIFGSGFVFFCLLGVGLQLAVDGSAPESLPVRLRRSAALFACGGLSLALSYFGVVDLLKAQSRGAFGTADADSARTLVRTLTSLAPLDGEVLAMRAAFEEGPDRLATLKRSAAVAPSTSNYRRLARAQLEAGQTASARASLNLALRVDPNNLPALRLLLEVAHAERDEAEARRVAERTVAVEETPYFQVRALPELIPTETYFARLALANLTSDPAERVAILRPAVDGYLRYAQITYPRVTMAATGGVPFAGETVEMAMTKLDEGRRAARELAEAARAAGQADVAKSADQALRDLDQ